MVKLPNIEEHVRFCVRDFGVENRELCYMVNSWIDAPVRTHGSYHRAQRHSVATPFEVCLIYGDKDLLPTPRNLLIARMVLQHFRLDGLITPAQEEAWRWVDTLNNIKKVAAANKLRMRILIPLGIIFFLVGFLYFYPRAFIIGEGAHIEPFFASLLFVTLGLFCIILAFPGSLSTGYIPTARVRAVIREKEIIKEKEVIIKVRCPYCGRLYNETLDVCPYCGGKR